MKGDISIPFIGVIVMVIIVLGILIPTKFMSVPTTRIIKYEQDNDNAQMMLISLLSSTQNGKTIQQLIGEYLILNQPDKTTIEQILKERLDKFDTECYKLSSSSKKIMVEKPDCTAKDYKKEVEIPLPYNLDKLTEKLTLVIS